MRNTNESRSPVGILLPAAVLGLLTTLLLMLLGAVLVQRSIMEENWITPSAFVFLAVGCFAAALFSAAKAASNKFVWALGGGMLVFLILLALSAALLAQPVHIMRVVISLLSALLASVLGGFAGAKPRKKKHYSHLKK